jgi:hypothetical protein
LGFVAHKNAQFAKTLGRPFDERDGANALGRRELLSPRAWIGRRAGEPLP